MADPRSPKSPRKGKAVNLRILFLNDTVHAFQVSVKATGQAIWDAVVNHLQMLEADYFGLEYTNRYGDECWLDCDKQILKQLPTADTPLRFGVKFYTPDPGLLEDELTRYCFALQVRKDLQNGHLHCSENTAALLASYIVQGEIGDFLIDEYVEISYLAQFDFLPKGQQTVEFLNKVMDYHKQHVGESPSEADINLLDTARKVEMYGIKFHPAQDHASVSLNLAVAHMGVLVFQGLTKINTFSWAKIRKLSFKRKKFLIKLHPESYAMRKNESLDRSQVEALSLGYYKDTVEFFFDSRDRCKYFWKKCIEHHAFFRCQTVKKVPRSKSRMVSRGSSFRYSGRTQKELQEYVRDSIVKRPLFERPSQSGRISSRSTSVTPKISGKPSMHNSSDLHNSTASSGSHILETSGGLPPLPPTRLETAEVHSDSSMSGSRSLGSPRLEHGLSADSDAGDFINQPVDMAAVDARLPHGHSPGAESSSDKFEPLAPYSFSTPYVNHRPLSLRSHRSDDENVTDADVDFDEFDDDYNKALPPPPPSSSSNLLSANQNGLDVGDSMPTDIKVPYSSLPQAADSVVPSRGPGSVSAVEHVANQTVPQPQPASVDLVYGRITVSDNVYSEITVAAGLVVDTDGVEYVNSSLLVERTAQAAAASAETLPTIAPAAQNKDLEHGEMSKPGKVVDREMSVSRDEADAKNSLSASLSGPLQDQALQTGLEEASAGASVSSSVTRAQIHAEDMTNGTTQSRKDTEYAESIDASLSPARPILPGPAQPVSPSSPAVVKVAAPAKPPKTLMASADLIEDIPYVLHRRQYKEGREGSRENSLHGPDTPSPQATLLRKSRSKSPRGRIQEQEGILPDGGTRHSRSDRSPSAGRRFELVHYNKLPARDSFSSVDDTTSPTHEMDFLKYGDISLVDGKSGASLDKEESVAPTAELVSNKETCMAVDDAAYITDEYVKSLPPSPTHEGPPSPPPSPNKGAASVKATENGEEHVVDAVNKVMKAVSSEAGNAEPVEAQREPISSHSPAEVQQGRPLSPPAEVQQGRPLSPPAEVQPDRSLSPPAEVQSDRPLSSSAAVEPGRPFSPPPPPPLSPTVSSSLPLPPPPEMQIPMERRTEIIQPPAAALPAATIVDYQTPKTSVRAKPKPPPVLPKSIAAVAAFGKKPPVAPKSKNAPSKPPRETTPPMSFIPSAVMPETPPPAPPPEVEPSIETVPMMEDFPPPPCEMTASIISHGGELDLELPPPPTELLLDMSPQSAGSSLDSLSSLPPLPAVLSPESVAASFSTSPVEATDKRPQSVPMLVRESHAGPDSEAAKMMDLPSPAAALMFSDSDSPPSQPGEVVPPPLTFTTFRPEGDLASAVITTDTDLAGRPLPEPSVSHVLPSSHLSASQDPQKRWSLERVIEEPEIEGDQACRPEPPKHVSWHEDTEDGVASRSFHSDVSMVVQRSPVDEAAIFGGCSPGLDSGDILQTLENLRQGSESDLTYSGSSGSSDGEDADGTTAKDVYLQYAATKCLEDSGRDRTIDSGMGELSSTAASSHHPESSPLSTLERLGSMEGSFGSDTRKASSPDDFPPPPPFLRSRGSTSSSSSLEMSAVAAALAQRRASFDPLLRLEGHDLIDMVYTTSESESDFDEEFEMSKLRQRPVLCEGAVGGVEEIEGEEGSHSGSTAYTSPFSVHHSLSSQHDS